MRKSSLEPKEASTFLDLHKASEWNPLGLAHPKYENVTCIPDRILFNCKENEAQEMDESGKYIN